MIRGIFCSIILFMVLPLYANADPSITTFSGSFSHGETVVISGSGFGSKSQAKPLRWDDFENGTENRTITTPSNLSYDTNNWVVLSNVAGHDPKYSTTRSHSGSKSAMTDNTSGSYNSKFGMNYTAYQGYGYVSWWVYRHDVSGIWTNFKPYRQYGSNGTGNVPEHNIVCGNDSCWTPSTTDNGTYVDNWGWLTGKPTGDTWERYEVISYSGTPGGNNGWLSYWKDGKHIKTVSNIGFLSAGSSYGWSMIRINDYFDTRNGSMQAWYDDVYIDNSQARIEIGDASTWDSCKHREIQIPKGRSNNSITITVNQGAFKDGQTVYLFVVDSNGIINKPGYPVVIGGDGGVTSPQTPSNPDPPSGIRISN